MKALSAAASVVRHMSGAAAEATLVAAIVAAIALVLSPVYGPARTITGADGAEAAKLNVTISLMGAARTSPNVAGGDVSFALTRSEPTDEVLWVTNWCFDANGAAVGRLDLPVRWGMWDSLAGEAGPFPTGGTDCKAYATWRPWQDRGIRGAVVEYGVQ